MTSRRRLGLVAAAATLFAAFPLSTIFQRWTWFIQCIIVVGLVAGAAALARTLRAPVWAQAAAMGGALLAALTWIFPAADGGQILGVIPTDRTFEHFGALLNQAGADMREKGIPVEDSDGLLFLTALGVGGVAVLVDLFSVALRRPALAGLPMLAIYSVPVAVHIDSVPAIPFIVGAIGFLWLLVSDNVDRVRRFGRRFTGDGRDVDLWEPSPLAAAGRRLAAVGVIAAIALPVAVPGMTTGLLDRFGPAGNGSGTGTGPGGNQVNLWALLQGELNRDDEFVMLEVRTGDASPGYLRFGVADVLSADGFRNRAPGLRSSASSLPDPRRTAPQSVTWVEGQARIKVVSFDMQLLPVYSQPLTTNLDSAWQYDSAMQVIYTNRTSTRKRQYDFTYVRPELTPEALRTAQPLAAEHPVQRDHTRLPGRVPQIEEKVAQLTRGLVNPYDKVRAIYNEFSYENGYEYSLETKQDTSGSAIIAFLTNKKGFCVQYAAALAWMVRAAGIPARVAFGFTRGSQREGDVSKLTNFNLHAWTEVYFDKFGWVPFDATPGTFIRGAVRPAYAPDVYSRDPEGSTNPSANPGATASAGAGSGEERDRPLSEEDQQAGAGGTTPADPRWPGYLVIGGALLLLLLVSPALRRLALRRRRRPTLARAARVAGADGGAGAPDEPRVPDEPRIVVGDGAETARARRDAHAAWDELVDTMVDLRLPVDPSETPRTTAERIIRDTMLPQAASADARLLGLAEERARYAREPLGTDRLGSALRAVRRALVQRVSLRTRLRAMLLPPSVLQRWRAVAVTRSTQTITMLAQARDSVLRVFSPRRLLPSRR
ncbi:MAG TPA: DUF3488 and transglutaminase-like domain-containing protein [Micromonosporaceae bacterium]|nr:DUF3488 and transglutaminase-like domain-containing protein [Micromonosporaceae bacterium]